MEKFRKTQNTTVVNLTNDDSFIYSLEPRAAVVAAWRQQVMNDYNWWDEPNYLIPPVVEGKVSITCGNMSALKRNRSQVWG